MSKEATMLAVNVTCTFRDLLQYIYSFDLPLPKNVDPDWYNS